MKKAVGLLGILFVLNCKAQTLPLNTLMEDIPNGAYLKDLNNELTPYMGIYQANYQGNTITLFITKEENKPTERMNKSYYKDALIVKYIIKNSSGIILQDTQNMMYNPNQKYHIIYSTRTKPNQNIIIFYYKGTNCGIGWGDIYLKKLNATQLSWEYEPNGSLIDSATCPPSTDKTVYLPVIKDLIFTKQ